MLGNAANCYPNYIADSKFPLDIDRIYFKSINSKQVLFAQVCLIVQCISPSFQRIKNLLMLMCRCLALSLITP